MQNLSMTRQSQLLRSLLVVTLLVLPVLTAANLPAQERPIEMKVTAADTAAATAFATNMRYHLYLAKTPYAKTVSPDSPGINLSFPKSPAGHPIASLPSFPSGTGFYSDDVEKLSPTGKTIVTTKSHPIYVNMASCGGSIATCWGNPAQFLSDLGISSMVHILDQYTGSIVNNRYTLGTQFFATTTIFPGSTGVPTMGESDILGLVHSAAKVAGSGYGHVYHVFLPKGVDHCFDEGPCYSPDNPGTFAFCAYHFTVHFSDLIPTNVYYSVEPYQGPQPSPLLSCEVPPGTVNGELIDSTNQALSHELFETISDPDINTGYRAVNSSFGEIGDLCQAFIFNGIPMGVHHYAIQAEYSDKFEACATTP